MKAISKEEAIERLVHHLRGMLLTAMIKEYKEPYQLSLFLKAQETRVRQVINDTLDEYKPPVPPSPPPPPPAQRR